MRRIIKNSSLYDLAPDLVKEWHPSANSTLTPRNVTIGYGKKVWWICRESHEWRATIKSRLKGNGCPLCGKEKPSNISREDEKTIATRDSYSEKDPRLAGAFFQPDGFNVDDSLGHDFRSSRRYQVKATAVLESPVTGHWFYADVKNFSAGGICLELDAFINPGTRVLIKLDRPLFEPDRVNYDSIIRWCKVLDVEDKSSSTHGMGAQFI